MQLVTDSGVLKTDPHKSQSFNHFHIRHSAGSAKRLLMSKQDIFFVNLAQNVILDRSSSRRHSWKIFHKLQHYVNAAQIKHTVSRSMRSGARLTPKCGRR